MDGIMGWIQEFMRDGIIGFAEASWAFLSNAFEAGTLTPEWWMVLVGGTMVVDTGGTQTSIEHPGMLNVMVVAMIPLLFIFVAVQVVLSLLRSSTPGLMRALLVALFSIPAVYIVTGIIWMAIGGFSEMSQFILTIGDEEGSSAAAGILALFGLVYDPATGEVILDENYQHWQMATGGEQVGRIILPFIIGLIIVGASLILMLMMIFRLVAILVLTMFGPIALFSVSLEPAKAVFSRWMSLLLGLLVAEPVAAAVVKFGMSAAAIGDSWVQLAAGLVLVLIAAAMPLVLLTLVSFITAGSSDGMERAAVGMGQSGGRVVRGGARRAESAARSAGRQITSGRRGTGGGSSGGSGHGGGGSRGGSTGGAGRQPGGGGSAQRAGSRGQRQSARSGPSSGQGGSPAGGQSRPASASASASQRSAESAPRHRAREVKEARRQ